MVGRTAAGEELFHGGDEVVGDSAADAAIGELDHVLGAAGLLTAIGKDLAIDADIAELIDDERQPLAPGAAIILSETK